MKMSIIVPVYYNKDNLAPMYDDLKVNVLDPLLGAGNDYELILVDDGSKDGSYEEILRLQTMDERIRAIRLSRNFGSHSAILAGLSVSTGDCVAMKAADQQEPSSLILEMLEKRSEGYSVVLAVRKDREESFSQKAFANLYYGIVRKLALPNMPKGGFDCFLIDRKVVNLLVAMEEQNTTLMGQILWCGFKTAHVYYVRQKRTIGKSKWTLKKKFKLVSDSIFGFSYFPVKFISTFGMLFFMVSIIWALVVLIMKLTGNITVSGYTTLAILILFGFGLVMFAIGILGEYTWRMFDSVRQRPPFIIDEVKTRQAK
ncbi:MAG: glycosyltransferase family 2 protein [Oscillospiraceae bacterium]|nr:glycosyltransferase family 2 protein [Oscillospiraceae bacterium]